MNKHLPILLDVPESVAESLLNRDSVLVRAGVIEGFGSVRNIEMSNMMTEFLSGWRESNIVECMFDTPRPGLLELTDYALRPKQRDILVGLLSVPGQAVNILFHGQSGAGKSTLAAALGRHLSLPIYEIRSQNDQSPKERMGQVLLAAEIFRSQEVLLIVDEADVLLSANPAFMKQDSIQKSFLNSFLEKLNAKIIWISNDVEALAPSSVRRFDFILNFEALPRVARVAAWNKILDLHSGKDSLDHQEANRLAGKYRLAPGIVMKSVQNWASLGKGSLDQSTGVLEELLHGYEQLLVREIIKPSVEASRPYCVDGLNLSMSAAEIVGDVKIFLERSVEDCGFSILFLGSLGSGRSRFAEYLATTLNRQLMVKKASELIVPIPGLSEKLLAAAFEEAEKEDAILFIDECEYFIRSNKPSGVQRDERLTNIFERHMRSFKGLLIGSTGPTSSLDVVAMRHWHICVSFKELNLEGRIAFFRLMLAPLVTSGIDYSHVSESLQSLENLYVGDFDIVRYRMLHRSIVTVETILRALAEENDLRTASDSPKRMGFSE